MTERDELFGANTIRLSPRQWTVTLALSFVALGTAPSWWNRLEDFDVVADYRIPYAVSKDYALYQQHLIAANDASNIFVVGDSVVWGEYVNKDGTLSHFLSHQDEHHTYVNAGINGLFPLALEGLATHYGRAMTDRKVLLHCNLLWMSSPDADLSGEKEQVFNHVELVPQFRVDIPCYHANVTERTAIAVRRGVPHLRWVRHLQVSTLEGQSLPEWTLADDGKYPPSFPHAYANPLAELNLHVAQEPKVDPQRGPASDRHRPWSESGRGPQSFDWVAMNTSLQWAAFQRLAMTLKERGNDVLVVVGPFNEHMIAESNRARFSKTKAYAEAWLDEASIPSISPAVLPSEHYGDASHPLTQGYELLARQLLAEPDFQRWLSK